MDDVTKAREREVDLLGLLEDFTLRTSFSDFFRAREVYEIEFPFLFDFVRKFLFYFQHEDRVASGAVLVDACSGDFARLFAHFDDAEELAFALKGDLSEAFDVDAACGAFFDAQVGSIDREEVIEGLFVDFEHGASEDELGVGVTLVDVAEDGLARG